MISRREHDHTILRVADDSPEAPPAGPIIPLHAMVARGLASDNRITMNENENTFRSELRQMGGLDDYAEKPLSQVSIC